ncbi:hypothetical protein SAMN05192576_1800 [Nocardioides szechwanensis]|uniref:EthD domain-containing protein n=2 Tax=Nocardioides szechwanensis TaxID=1005944 RepID=A0A1G9ZPJ9_9ACTN|nr:hypothetical protein SAMN05192576_1800 [Nocardioides szechwanensis]
MFALWGPDLTASLHSADLREALKAAGAERLQVNVDDAHVAPAMRIPTGDEPIGAIVSVWTSGPADVVVAALTAVAERVAGWEVEERRPIDPPETWDGSRSEGLANVAVLRRPDELSQEEWLHRWLVDHTPIAIATQATFGYLQNVVVAPVTPDAPPIMAQVHALVEELFPIEGMSDMHAFYGSGGDDAVLNERLTTLMASVARIGADRDLDLVPTSRYLYSLT